MDVMGIPRSNSAFAIQNSNAVLDDQVEARESAQDQLIARHREQDSFSARRVTLVTNPAVENS